MTEQWKSTAAKRFNDKIRLQPTDWYWGQQATAPVAEPQPEPLVEMVELVFDAAETTYNWWLDTVTLGRVA